MQAGQKVFVAALCSSWAGYVPEMRECVGTVCEVVEMLDDGEVALSNGWVWHESMLETLQ